MYQVIIVVHVLLGLGVIGLILMQQGKGADAGAAFGSGSSGSVFGAQGAASFLSRTTAILATLFFTTSLTLAVLSGHQSKTADIMDSVEAEQKVTDVPSANKTSAPELIAPATDKATAEQAVPPVSVTNVPTVSTNNAAKTADLKAGAVDNSTKVDENKKPDAVAEKADAKSEEKPAEKKSDKKSHDSDKSDKKKHSDKKDSSKHTKKQESSKSDKKDK